MTKRAEGLLKTRCGQRWSMELKMIRVWGKGPESKRLNLKDLLPG